MSIEAVPLTENRRPGLETGEAVEETDLKNKGGRSFDGMGDDYIFHKDPEYNCIPDTRRMEARGEN